MRNAAVLVIGAGPGGLAVAAALGRRGVPALVLERSDGVGASWRRHYERLHLHTTRRWSSLPGLPIPREFGRWVARADVVRYLELYTAHHGIDVRTGVEVSRVARDGYGRWVLEAEDGESFAGSTVVVATGYNHTRCRRPGRRRDVPGRAGARLGYRTARPYRGKDVLVVGAGNTGRRSPWTSPRAVPPACGSPSDRAAHRPDGRTSAGRRRAPGSSVRHLPVPVVDKIAAAVARLEVPDLSSYGLPRPTTGLYSRVREGSVPLQDVGLIAAVQARRVEPVAARRGRSTTGWWCWRTARRSRPT